MQMTDMCCALCVAKFTQAQLIPVNGTPEQVEILKAALPTRKQKMKSGSKRTRSSATADPP